MIPGTSADTIIFYVDKGKEIIRLEGNGDIFVRGKKIENDKLLVDALRDFLLLHIIRCPKCGTEVPREKTK